METEGVAQIDSSHVCPHVFPILPLYRVSEPGASHRAVYTEEENPSPHSQLLDSFRSACVDEPSTRHLSSNSSLM